ncbi:MAG TPA: hypothetical protein VFW13_09400 [Phenylobacterium sp.]|nr:hypothetical protein [Phenylobacterium sp.]
MVIYQPKWERAVSMVRLVLATVSVAATGHAEGYHASRTHFGQPDLQGVWTNASATYLERPAGLSTLIVGSAEAAAYEKRRAERYAKGVAPVAPDEGAPPVGKPGQDSVQWYAAPSGLARIGGQIRSSWIVVPADGRLPARAATVADGKAVEFKDDHAFDNPEERPLDERCVMGASNPAGPPIQNPSVNPLLQIVQTPDSVVLVAEMNHDARIIRLGARGHLPATIRPWMGDSIGWWEGDTLVVETTNFSPAEHWRWDGDRYFLITEGARVTERFTRTGPGEILYRFEVVDPKAYTQPWRGEMPLRATSGQLMEYACHEGNYALPGILAGARAEERARPVGP